MGGLGEAGETGSRARLPPVEVISRTEEAVETERCKRQRSYATIETAGVVSSSEAMRRLSQMGRKALVVPTGGESSLNMACR